MYHICIVIMHIHFTIAHCAAFARCNAFIYTIYMRACYVYFFSHIAAYIRNLRARTYYIISLYYCRIIFIILSCLSPPSWNVHDVIFHLR